MEKKYYNIEKKYLAEGLAWLGYKYFKFIGDKGITVYGFEDTEDFRRALTGMMELKNRFGKYLG